jgi:NitT/TauT family transport system substrate-binding protein
LDLTFAWRVRDLMTSECHIRSTTSAAATLCLVLLAAAPAAAQTRGKAERAARPGEVAIGVGHGIGFLPLFIAHDLGLLEKHAKANGLNGRLIVRRFQSAAPMQQALSKGEIAAGAFGVPAFLLARDAVRNTPQDLLAVSGITTLPLVLVTARPDIRALTDIKPADKIAVPMLNAPQVTYLRMQTDQWFTFGAWNRLRQQLVAMPHQESLEALTGGREVAAYFSSPPFTQIALRDPKIRAIMSSADIMGGKVSFLLLASQRGTLASHPKLPETVAKAIDEAADIIRKDPRRAAMIWLKWEPSHTLDARAVEGVLRDLKDDFGSGVFGVEATATYLRKDSRLKDGFWSWKDVVAPAIAAGQGS